MSSTRVRLFILVAFAAAAIFSAPTILFAPHQAAAQAPEPPFEKPGRGLEEPYLPTPALEAGPFFAPADQNSGTRTAYESYRTGNWEIYAGDGQGYGLKNLTNHPAQDTTVRLNRDSTRIAFASNRDGDYEIYTANIDGSGLTRLTYSPGNDYDPYWSPDDSQILFTSTRDGNAEIYGMKSDGTGVWRVTNSPEADIYPAFAPDGVRFSWVRYANSKGTLFVWDGTQSVAILSDKYYMGHPTWSPDGTLIGLDYDFDGDYWNDLVTVSPDGANATSWNTGSYMRDKWWGSWGPVDRGFVYTIVEYTVNNNQLVVGSTQVYQLGNNGSLRLLGQTSFDLGPDWHTADIWAPSTTLNPLPEYTAGMGTPLSWTATDSGPAGLQRVEIEIRTSLEDAWSLAGIYYPPVTSTFISYPDHGDTCFFRMRGIDWNDNAEEWTSASTGDTFTSLYAHLLYGQVTDNRNFPIASLPISITPSTFEDPITDQQGKYILHTDTWGNPVLEVARQGYGALPAFIHSGVLTDTDVPLDLMLPPMENILQNANFESGSLSGWASSGDGHTGASKNKPHTGTYAAILGYGDTGIISTDLSTNSSNSGFDIYPWIAAAPDGTLYTVYNDEELGGIVFTTRPPAGSWSAPVLVDTGWNPKIIVGGDGTAHLIYSYSSNLLMYRSYLPGGPWSSPEIVLGCGTNYVGNISFEADDSGGVHLLSRCSQASHMSYRSKASGGVWSAPTATDLEASTYAFDIDGNGRLHLLKGYYEALSYTNWLPGEPASVEPFRVTNLLFHGSPNHSLNVDPDGTVHAAWIEDNAVAYTFKYATRSPGGTWSSHRVIDTIPITEVLPRTPYTYSMRKGTDGTIHFTWSFDGSDVYYRKIYPGGSLSVILPVTNDGDCINSVPTNDGVAHFVWRKFESATLSYEAKYGEFNLAPTSTITLSQAVTIPADMNQPTLSFAYLVGPFADGSLRLTAAANGTPVFTATQPSAWSYASADLSAWAGQTITLTIQRYAEGEGVVSATLLDEVAIGGWETPIVHSVSPPALQDWASATITVTGQNFFETASEAPSVRIGSLLVTDVSLIDEHTLRLTLPISLKTGSYDVWVINPGGAASQQRVRLLLGRPIYLPLIGR